MRDRWRDILVGASVVLGVLHVVDAFFVELPLVSIVLAALFAAAAYWVLRDGRASVVIACAVCGLRLALAVGFIFFGPTTSLSAIEVLLVSSFAIASAAGVIAAIGTLRTKTFESLP